MRRTSTTAPILVGLLLLSLVAAAGGAAAGAGGASAVAASEAATAVDPQLEQCAEESPENFTAPAGGDAIGYVDGYWYDEPIVVPPDDGSGGENATDANGTGTSNGTDDGNAATKPGNASTQFNASDGLSDRELSALVTRTAARVETLRCHSFASVPPVEVVNRSTVRANQLQAIANRSAAARRFDDAMLSTALLLGDDANASEARAETTAAATLGYYDSIDDEIVIVAEDGEVSALDEPTLAHELVHALQDQQFDLRRFDAALTDAAFAETGLIEGDASLVGHRYRTRCEDGDWARGCLNASTPTPGNSEYLGLELFRFQPYNDGPAYVESLYARGGWSAVDERYDDPPASTRELLYPTTPASFEPANVSVEPVNDSAWTRVAPAGRPSYDVLGPGTIGATMLAPTFDGPETENVYSVDDVTNDGDQSTLDPLQPYDYAVDANEGWEGGRLEVYRNDANLTAARWRTEWESEMAAATFLDRYVQLLDVRGSQRSDEYVDTYSFPAGSGYDGTYAVRRNGSSVVIVHGPGLQALRALDERAARELPDPLPSSTGGTDASKPTEDALSGPGAVGAVLGVLVAVGTAAAIVARRRS